MSERILVIGGNGYIGSRLVQVLIKEEKYNVTVVDSNEYVNDSLLNQNKIRNSKGTVLYVIARYQDLGDSFFLDFDTIILLAGQSSVSNSTTMDSVMTNNILNFSRLSQIIKPTQKFIYASSSSVYGKTECEACEACEDSKFGEPYNYYDFSKQTIDNLASLSGKMYFGLRFGTVNGYSDNLRNDLMINSMLINGVQQGKIFVSNKDINRPILGIGDLCNGILKILQKGNINNSGVYNMNSFNATVDEIAKGISTSIDCEIGYLEKMSEPSIISKAYDFRLHSEKFEKTFDFKFTNTLNDIIEDLQSNWYNVSNAENRLSDFDFEYLETCLVCDTKTVELLDLGYQPLANSYHDESEMLQEYPLVLHRCPQCFHVQLNAAVNPDKLFKKYVYISGTSQTLREYFFTFALYALRRFALYNGVDNEPIKVVIKVLDIACNDGSQLDAFEKIESMYQHRVKFIRVGVDPAENIYNSISKDKNHDILCEYFQQKTVDKLKKKYGSFDIIIAQHVVAHVQNPSEFLRLCKQLIKEENGSDGICLIQTSQKDMVSKAEFDTVYHEHLSFFNTNSMKYICNRNDLSLNNVDNADIQGGSYIFEVVKYTPTTNEDFQKSNTIEVLYEEMCNGLYSDELYEQYKIKCLMYRNKFHNTILQYKLQGKTLIGIASPAKAQVILNFARIDTYPTLIDFIIDENQLKVGLYTPGSNILVTDFSILRTINPNTVLLIMAWNFEKELLEKVQARLKEYKINFPVEVCNIKTLETQFTNLNQEP